MHKKPRLEQDLDTNLPKARENDGEKIGSTRSQGEEKSFDLPNIGEPIKQITLKEFPRKNQRCF